MSPTTVVVLLALLLGIQPVTTDVYLPALPAMQADLRAAMAEVQLTFAALLLAFGVSQLVWGPLSDRFGRRPVLLVGMGGYVLASLACGIHCLALPVAMPLLLASGWEFVAEPWFELLISLSIFVIALRTLRTRWHRGPLDPISLGLLAGLGLLLAGNLHSLFGNHAHHHRGFELDVHMLIPAGALLIALCNGLDWWKARHQGCAHNHG